MTLPRPVAPGATLLHPVALVAIATLVLNDHVLKRAYPGLITGKLSDFAGLVFFPLFLLSLLELGLGAWARQRAVVLGAVLLTGAVFAWVKTSVLGAETYRVGLGLLQWPFGAARALASGLELPGLWRVALARDATDLVALPALGIPLFVALGRRARTRA